MLNTPAMMRALFAAVRSTLTELLADPRYLGAQAGAVTETDGAVLRLDLVGTARRILEAADVDRVDDTGLCTACESERFFSHRRDGTTGRQLAIGMRR